MVDQKLRVQMSCCLQGSLNKGSASIRSQNTCSTVICLKISRAPCRTADEDLWKNEPWWIIQQRGYPAFQVESVSHEVDLTDVLRQILKLFTCNLQF